MPDTAFPTIGILGGGQLGRMTALAAIRMGLLVRFLAPKPDGPMEGLGERTVADWNDPEVLRRFAEGCAVVTVESEWAPAEHLADVLPTGTALWPSPETLLTIRHKGRQKRVLADAGLPVTPVNEALAEGIFLPPARNQARASRSQREFRVRRGRQVFPSRPPGSEVTCSWTPAQTSGSTGPRRSSRECRRQ
mgnify:CR=1 FL=1